MERELEKDLKEIEYLIYVHKNRGNTNTQSVLERVHEIIEPCAKAARTLSELEELLSRENGREITRSSRDNDIWIPVDERLPEDETMMLVTCQTKAGRRSVNRAWYGAGCWHGTGSMSGVTAWMPLPAPYRLERSSNEEE